MNKIILIGRLTKDIEVKTSQSGTELARFSLAVTRPFKNKQSDKYETDFFDCVVWRQDASLLANTVTRATSWLLKAGCPSTTMLTRVPVRNAVPMK